MKRLFVFIICLLPLACSPNKQEMYEEKMLNLQLKIGNEIYNELIDSFREFAGKYPDSLREVYLAYKDSYPKDIENIELRYFIDVFSKNEEWVGYFPIYDDEGSEIISYVILSAGIDGKLDNVVDPSEKLRIDNWKQKLKLYNPDEFDEVTTFVDKFNERQVCYKGNIEHRPYNAKEEKFGGKDLLIHYHIISSSDVKYIEVDVEILDVDE